MDEPGAGACEYTTARPGCVVSVPICCLYVPYDSNDRYLGRQYLRKVAQPRALDCNMSQICF